MIRDQEIKKFWIMLAAYYDRDLSELVLKLYAEHSKDILPVDLQRAWQIWIDRGNSRFPLPHDLRQCLKPKLDPNVEANEVVSRIFDAIAKHGYTSSNAAHEFMGELAWTVVEAMGGWYHLCTSDNLGSNGTIRAQMRDIAISKIERHKQGLSDVAPALSLHKPERGGLSALTPVKDIVSGLITKK